MITTKVSKATPAPRRPVMTISLINPSILETKVQKETNPLLASSFKDFFRNGLSSIQTYSSSVGLKSMDTEFIQYLSPVG